VGRVTYLVRVTGRLLWLILPVVVQVGVPCALLGHLAFGVSLTGGWVLFVLSVLRSDWRGLAWNEDETDNAQHTRDVPADGVPPRDSGCVETGSAVLFSFVAFTLLPVGLAFLVWGRVHG
jgi:hypothetical protein